MTTSFDLPTIQAELKGLDEIQRIAFGTLLLERALPSYFQFQIETGFSGGSLLWAASAQCWAALEARTRKVAPFVSVQACESALPDSEDYASPYTSAAIDTANIACCMLEYLEDGQLTSLIEAVQARGDTLYLFIVKDLDNEKVWAHPMMQEELRFMHDDIAFLRNMSSSTTLHTAVLERVRQLDYQRLRLKLEDL